MNFFSADNLVSWGGIEWSSKTSQRHVCFYYCLLLTITSTRARQGIFTHKSFEAYFNDAIAAIIKDQPEEPCVRNIAFVYWQHVFISLTDCCSSDVTSLVQVNEANNFLNCFVIPQKLLPSNGTTSKLCLGLTKFWKSCYNKWRQKITQKTSNVWTHFSLIRIESIHNILYTSLSVPKSSVYSQIPTEQHRTIISPSLIKYYSHNIHKIISYNLLV